MYSAKEVRAWMDTVNVDLDFNDNRGFWDSAKMYVGSFDQIKWERDLAIEQLRDLGYELGQKKRGDDDG